MIRGYCIGGGLGVALQCDLRIATRESRFGIPAARLGVGYGHSGLRRLMDVVGPAFAMDMTYAAMADSIGMAMANAVASQQRAQTMGSAALAQVLTLILKQGAKSS